MFKKILIFFILMILAVAGFAYWIYAYQLNAPLPIKEEVVYDLEPNSTLSKVAMDMMALGWMNYPTALSWVWLARFQDKAKNIKRGQYAISPGTTPQTLLEIFIAGQSIQYSLTLLEGWNFRQVLNALHQHSHLKQSLEGLTPSEIMTKLGLEEVHPEGQFFPDTYHFPAGTTDLAVLQRAYETMQRELQHAWSQRQENLPISTPYEALTLASIIEKETAAPDEHAQVAGVFIRRLQKNMRLQTDPTVIYALGEKFDGNIRKRDLSIDSPYNTYRYYGLPPTPIAMPGQKALLAAVNPDDSEAIFFVAKGNGTHQFSATLAEHQCAVIRYQLKGKSPRRYRQWCQRHPRCEACNH